jgi:uncharacterized OB-fold protein
MTRQRVPIQEGLFTWPAQSPQLIASRCAGCGIVSFPARGSCPACAGEDTGQELLARRGTLWSWTVQAFRPPSPPYAGPGPDGDFEPFGVGYVELAGQVIVEARLTEADPDRLRIGMDMELALIPFGTDESGAEVLTFAFAPCSGNGGPGHGGPRP